MNSKRSAPQGWACHSCQTYYGRVLHLRAVQSRPLWRTAPQLGGVVGGVVSEDWKCVGNTPPSGQTFLPLMTTSTSHPTRDQAGSGQHKSSVRVRVGVQRQYLLYRMTVDTTNAITTRLCPNRAWPSRDHAGPPAARATVAPPPRSPSAGPHAPAADA